MPPKRKAAATKAAGKGAKRVKAADGAAAKPALEKKSTLQKALSVAKKVAATGSTGSAAKVTIKVDSRVPNAQVYKVHEDYDAMLNQTNIGQNNNKFYVIQVLQSGASFYCWNRWGRVGESGQSNMARLGSAAAAESAFKKKFSDKTKNKWEDRAKFTPVRGKYTLLEMSYDDDDTAEDTAKAVAALSSGNAAAFEASKLDTDTQRLMDLLFSSDMFRNAMQDLKIDVKKMPLGKLSKAQIAKGFEVLEEIERELDGAGNRGKLSEMSSRFYTVVPHNFGRLVPPVIQNKEMLREKLDMLLVLSDIVVAQTLQKENEVANLKSAQSSDKKPNPLDANYNSLKCRLELVSQALPEFKVIETYQKQTGGVGKIVQAWRVDREGEEERHEKAGDSKLGNRKLLWHGTNVAVVAAILKSGLRIMPHSGGRVGRGIYFASEQGKSACYTSRTSNKTGIMFLNEVALGKVNKITVGNSSYTKAPPGFDSILAEGRTEPDPAQDTTLKVGKRDVTVPQGKPKHIGPSDSQFSQSEYLVYKESQCRIRYLLRIQF